MDEAIIAIECDEPKGKFLRSIYPMPLSRSNLLKFWEHSSKYPTIFNTEIRGDFQKFCELFIDEHNGELTGRGLFWRVDDFVGVVYMTNIQPAHDALVHMSFFDGRLKGRQPLMKAMLQYVFKKYMFRRLTAEVPEYVVPYTIDFVKALGFKFEGKKRRSTPFDNKYFDTNIFGVLREELLNG